MTTNGFSYKMALLVVVLSWLAVAKLNAQVNDPFNASRQRMGGGGTSVFNQDRKSNFNDYRHKLNVAYVKMTRERWSNYKAFREALLPDKDAKPVTPVEMSDEESRRRPEDNVIVFDGVERPIRQNRTVQPVSPVKEMPEENAQLLSFTYLGTELTVRKPQGARLSLRGVDANAIADAWQEMSGEGYNNLIVDCLKLRSGRSLCDWAYLQMLKAMGTSLYPGDANTATLLTAFVFSQSGYKMRLGESGGRLHLLFASQHNIYNWPYFTMDGEQFYPLDKNATSLNINPAKYPKEQALSLWVNREMKIEATPTQERIIVSKRYPDMSVKVSVNKNLLDFYESYPTSDVGGNFMTRWAMYAGTPLCGMARDELYPQLRALTAGLSQVEAVNRILNWIQTGLVYEYDDKVWGQDRAFFPDETLYYPYCDCEDRSILFTRIVRDLFGLQCILIYYPGHLASAVCFTDNVEGDYINVEGKKFVVCDPTFIGAPVGRTMTDMDNGTAKVILL